MTPRWLDVPPTIAGLTQARDTVHKQWKKERERADAYAETNERLKLELRTALATIKYLKETESRHE